MHQGSQVNSNTDFLLIYDVGRTGEVLLHLINFNLPNFTLDLDFEKHEKFKGLSPIYRQQFQNILRFQKF